MRGAPGARRRDPAKGWSRDQAAEFLAAHTVIAPTIVQGEIDRYISVPGQASGGCATEAERRLGERFDIREFHDRVLEDGALPLPVLRAKLVAWIGRGDHTDTKNCDVSGACKR